MAEKVTKALLEKGKDLIVSKVTPDPKDLMADTGGPETREFFWDKMAITLATLITSLSALDFLTKFLGGDNTGSDGAICFVPEEFNASAGQNKFIQSFCSQGLQKTKYLTIFVPILGFIIGAVHFVWRSGAGNSFMYFFSLAKTLSQVKDENTGEYPQKNTEIVKKLIEKFSLYESNDVLQSYRLKLISQIMVSVVSIGLVAISFVYLANFDALFYAKFDCPEAKGGYNLSAWPYDNMTVSCISVSVQYFWLLRLVDVSLFCFIIVTLISGLVYVTCWPHPKELNVKQAALFSFITGVNNMYYVPKPLSSYLKTMCNLCCCICCTIKKKQKEYFNRRRQLWWRRTPRWYRTLRYHRPSDEEEPFVEIRPEDPFFDESEDESEEKHKSHSSAAAQDDEYPFPRIATDLHFFLFILYRTDNNLAHAFYEGQVSIEYKALMELDRFLIDNRELGQDIEEVDSDDSKRKVIARISTGWSITKHDNKERFSSCAETKIQTNPRTGKEEVKFATKIPIPNNIRGAVMGVALRALRNDRAACVSFGSLGYSKVITRVFKTVGSLNFDSDYRNKEKPVSPVGLGDGDGVLRYHVIDDVFTKPNEIYDKWHDEILKLWEGCSIYDAIPFMVIGPMTRQQQLATAELLVGEWQRTETFDDGAVLVIVEIEKIEGTTPEFFKLRPSKRYFQEFNPELVRDPEKQSIWPVRHRDDSSEDGVRLKTVPYPDVIPFKKGKGVSLEYRCGDTLCRFRIRCYRYMRPPRV